MARIAIDAALGSGLALIRRQPGAVLLWGLATIAFMAANLTVEGSFDASFFANIATGGSPATMNAVGGWTWLMDFIDLFASVLLYCAVFRAILHPEKGWFAYLRVGKSELLLFGLLIAAMTASFAVMFIGFFIVHGLGAAMTNMHATAAGTILGLVALVAAVVTLVWLALRVSMVGPMTVADRKFHLLDAWALTKGNAGALLILSICLVPILVLGELAIVGVLKAGGLKFMATATGELGSRWRSIGRPAIGVPSGIGLSMIAAAIIATPLVGCLCAVWAAPWARAYLDLTEPGPAAIAA